MFEKMSQLAEQAATSASRREFLGRLGRSALNIAAMTGGILALPAVSHAGRRPPRVCGAGSAAACLGLNEGDGCTQERAFGVCQGQRRRGDKSTVTICGCTAEAPR
jgi:hypothetical protein